MADNHVRQKWTFNPASKMTRAAQNATGKKGLKAQSFGASESVQYIAERKKKKKKATFCTNVLMNGVAVQALQIFSSHRQNEGRETDLQSLDLAAAAAPDTRSDAPAASCTLYIICALLQRPVAGTRGVCVWGVGGCVEVRGKAVSISGGRRL